jgi:hypothetical protein
VEGDARGFKVALVASEYVNPGEGGLDALAVLEGADWGLIQLPAADYPAKVAAPLLDQVAEQAQEFSRHGYKLAVIGGHKGLAAALDRYGVAPPPQIDPTTPAKLRAFLKRAAR